MRARVIDILLAVAAVIGALWLAALLYHNYLGGHVVRDEPVGDAARARMAPVSPPRFV